MKESLPKDQHCPHGFDSHWECEACHPIPPGFTEWQPTSEPRVGFCSACGAPLLHGHLTRCVEWNRRLREQPPSKTMRWTDHDMYELAGWLMAEFELTVNANQAIASVDRFMSRRTTVVATVYDRKDDENRCKHGVWLGDHCYSCAANGD